MCDVVAVVPVFVTTGAVLLPSLIAVMATIGALLVRPRQLYRLCLSHRRATFLVICGIAILFTGIHFVSKASLRLHRPQAAMDNRIGWEAVAKRIIAAEAAGLPALPSSSGFPATQVAQTTAPSEGGAKRSLQLVWKFAPPQTMFMGKPIITRDRIYTAACQVDLGGYTGMLACLNRRTGLPLWQITQLQGEYLRPFFSSPALTADEKYLIVGQGFHEDKDCSLLCIEAASGKLHWAVKTPLHIESSPAVAGDTVVVGVGAIEDPTGASDRDPGFVLAVRISDGRVLWRERVVDPESSPAIAADGSVYIGSGVNGNAVVALRHEQDEELQRQNLKRLLWRAPTGQPMTGPITLWEDLVMAGGGNGDIVHSNEHAQGVVVALNRQSGAIVWQTALPDAVLGRVVPFERTLLCPVRNGEVIALDSGKGQIRWRTRISGDAPILSACCVQSGCIYAVSSDGYLAVLKASDGAMLAKTRLNDEGNGGSGLTVSSPQVVDGQVIVGSETGGLRCLHAWTNRN